MTNEPCNLNVFLNPLSYESNQLSVVAYPAPQSVSCDAIFIVVPGGGEGRGGYFVIMSICKKFFPVGLGRYLFLTIKVKLKKDGEVTRLI